jgi:nicotinate phosphoribosyltransferase
VIRNFDGAGFMAGDLLTTMDAAPAGQGLLQEVMRNGRRLQPSPSVQDVRRRAQEELARLPAPLRGLSAAPAYPVTVSEPLRALAREVDRQTTAD